MNLNLPIPSFSLQGLTRLTTRLREVLTQLDFSKVDKTSDETIGGDKTFSDDVNIDGVLSVGVNDTTYGDVRIYGSSANQGGLMRLYNSDDYDATDEYWGVYSYNGEFRVKAGTGNVIFRIEADDTLSVTGTTNYEDLVTDDDDIPNAAYVDITSKRYALLLS